MELKISRIGNSMGVIFPKELMSKLNLDKGDSLFLVETPEGMLISPYNPEFAAQMETARGLMRKRRNVLRELGQVDGH